MRIFLKIISTDRNRDFMDFSINRKICKISYEKRTKQKTGKILASNRPILADLELIFANF
jgi:hypothetical protein